MTITYPHDRPLPLGDRPEDIREEPFVPVYARSRRTVRGRKGGLKTWMILAPVGVLVLGAGAAAMVMGGDNDVASAPLIEPAATAPVLPAQPLTSEAPAAEPPIVEAAPVATPDARPTAPATVRRAAPTRAPAPAPTPAARVEAPAEPTGPQPYTATLNAAPAPAPAPAPVIVIQPAD